MELEEKLSKLNIKPMTDEIYHKHLKKQQLLGHEIRQFKYFKFYGKEPMFYSQEYLTKTSINELIEREKRFKKTFGYSFFGKIRRKIQSKLLRWGL